MYRRLCLPKVSIWVIIFIMMIISTCISGQTFTFVRQRPVDYIGKPLVMKCTVDGKNGVLLWVRNGITVGEDADPYNKTLYSGTVAGETYKLNINFLSRSAEENVEWYCVNNGKESTRINITEATISAVMDTTLKRNDILNLTKQDVKDNFHSEIVTSCSNPVATVTWKYADVDKPNVMKNVTFGVNTTGITSCGNCEAGEVCTRSTLDLPVSRLGGHKVLLSVEIVHPSLDTPLVFSSPAEITFLSQKDDTIVWALALAVVSGILCAAVIAVIVVVVVISASALVKKYLVITVIVLGSVCCVIGLVIAVLLGRSDDGSHERPEWVAAAVFCALDFIAGISGIIFGYLKLKALLQNNLQPSNGSAEGKNKPASTSDIQLAKKEPAENKTDNGKDRKSEGTQQRGGKMAETGKGSDKDDGKTRVGADGKQTEVRNDNGKNVTSLVDEGKREGTKK